MKLSIIIPTYNRKERLHRVLDGLRLQVPQVVGGAEIVVVDDGSTDGTFESLSKRIRLAQIRAYRQTNQGPAAARNLAAKEAKGELIFFLDDDMLPEPGLLAAHLEAHERHIDPDFALAVLGYPTWVASSWQEARFYNHLNENGLYFGYSLIEDPDSLPFFNFYTCSTSLQRSVFLAHGGFDTEFPKAAYEDFEFGYRAMVKGCPGIPKLKLVLCREARTRHENPLTFDSYLTRQRMIGRWTLIFLRKHPELSDWLGIDRAISLSPNKPWRVSFMEMVARLGHKIPIPVPLWYYNRTSDWAFLQGVREGFEESPDFRPVSDLG